MSIENREVIINNRVFVPKNSTEKAEELDKMPYQIVRTYTAGVFAGYVEARNGQEVTMRQARRLWRWDGAASLSQLAMEGTKKPERCKFPCPIDQVVLTQAIEILDTTEKARKSIIGVPIWQI